MAPSSFPRSGTSNKPRAVHLRADSVPEGTDEAEWGAAISQEPLAGDGAFGSGLHLGFTSGPNCPTVNQVPCWSFWQVQDNDANSDEIVSRTAVPVVEGEWVHVVGIYDAVAETVQAYACPLGSYERPVAGTLGELGEGGSGWSAWTTTGPLRLGSGVANGTPRWAFAGAVDEVRVYPGAPLDDGTLQNICLGTPLPIPQSS